MAYTNNSNNSNNNNEPSAYMNIYAEKIAPNGERSLVKVGNKGVALVEGKGISDALIEAGIDPEKEFKLVGKLHIVGATQPSEGELVF